jgi:hypothetical protein
MRPACNVANIDNLGHVHPDTMWWHHSLGSVRERPFSQIWADTSDPLMAGLKAHPRPVGGRCADCRISTSAAATPGCVRSSSRMTPGPKTRAATCAMTKSARQRQDMPAHSHRPFSAVEERRKARHA